MDITLNYIEKGEGFPLILLHGNGESLEYFKFQMEEFPRSYHVYAVDTRGHGASPRGTAPFTLSQFADDLRDFMNCHNIKKAHILGFSDGGNIALMFALRYPERVEKLILNGANLYPSGLRAMSIIPITIGYGVVCAVSLIDKRANHRRELSKLMVDEPQIEPSQLKTLHMPVLVIAGTLDMVRSSHTRLIAASIPNSELCIINGDHFIAAKKSRKFNAAVLEFLA